MKNTRRNAKNTARLAALALSAFLLSGAAHASDLHNPPRDSEPIITITGYDKIVLEDQRYPDDMGGALYAYGGDVMLSVGTIIARNNLAKRGGAIWAASDVELTGTEISFDQNTAFYQSGSSAGGAIWASGKVTVTGGAISFDLNKAEGDSARGGAIYSENNIVTVTGDSISFTENSVSSPETDNNEGTALGGAIYAQESIDISAAESLQLIGNSAVGDNASGSALWARNIVLRGGVIRVQSNDVKFTSGGN